MESNDRGWHFPLIQKARKGHYFVRCSHGYYLSLCGRYAASKGTTFFDTHAVSSGDCRACARKLPRKKKRKPRLTHKG